MLTITIAGTDVSGLVEQSTLVITQVLTRRGDTAELTLVDASPARGFAPLQQITIADELGNLKFGGLLTRIRRSADQGPGANYFRLSCQDFTYYLQKTLANKKYQNQGIDAIVQDLLISFPAGGITTHNVQAGLPVLAHFAASHLKLSDALDKLVRMSLSYLMWDVDANKDLHFFDQVHVPVADVALTDATPGTGQAGYRRDTFWHELDATQLANQITVRGGSYLSNAYTQMWVGNGQQTGYPFDYPPNTTVQAGGYLPVVSVGGAAQTVALDTNQGFGSNNALVSVAQDSRSALLRLAATPASGATIQATYVFDLPVLVRRKDPGSIAAYGTWESYVVDTTIATQSAAGARAGGELGQFSRVLARAHVDVERGYSGGLGAGQLVTLTNQQLGISAQLICTGCTIRGQSGGRYTHSLTLAQLV